MESLGQELKKRNTEYVAGLDLTDTFSQISVGTVSEGEVETLTVSVDASTYLIPTALFKRSEVNQWFAGRDAYKYKDTEGFYIDKLVSKAMSSEEVTVGNLSFRPSALLALFMKRTLTLINTVTSVNNLSALVITTKTLNNNLVTALSEAVETLGIPQKNVFFQSHRESFYSYMINQPEDLWKHDVFLLDASEEYVNSMCMECNKNTTPIVAFIDSQENLKLPVSGLFGSDNSNTFTGFADELVDGHIVSSIFLIGDAFKGEALKEGVNHLCHKGRVFQGNNLFTKGACYSARNRVNPTETSKKYVFLGNEKLKANVGINLLIRGEKTYLPLLDGGVNWFDAVKECDFYLTAGNRISFVITPLTGKNPEVVDITLSDLPKRPPKTTRLNVKVKMLSETRMLVTIKDMGFGELYPSSNIEWNEEISV